MQELIDRQQRKTKELELWRRWKTTGDQIALQELFDSLRPLIKKLSTELTGNLPPSSIEAKVKREVMHALETYQPEMSALNTHIVNTSRKVLRDIYKYQNVGRLPEATTIKVPSYVNLRANLTNTLGREPTYGEIADELKTSVREVMRMEAGTRKDLSHVEGMLFRGEDAAQREKDILEHVYYELTPEEQRVYEATFGLNGKREMTNREIASSLGISQAKVAQIKHRIAGIVERYYGHR